MWCIFYNCLLLADRVRHLLALSSKLRCLLVCCSSGTMDKLPPPPPHPDQTISPFCSKTYLSPAGNNRMMNDDSHQMKHEQSGLPHTKGGCSCNYIAWLKFIPRTISRLWTGLESLGNVRRCPEYECISWLSWAHTSDLSYADDRAS